VGGNRELDGVLGLENLVELFKLDGLSVFCFLIMRGIKLTVLFLVSGKTKYAMQPWMEFQTMKMIYVFHSICLMAIGQANWFMRPAALTANDCRAIPLARMLKLMHSTG
jgi:hypothetical protein